MPRAKQQPAQEGRVAVFVPEDPIERAEVAEMEADALFSQLMAANAAPEPGMQAGTMIGKSIDDQGGTLAVPMVAAQVESAGYTLVYDQATGETSTVNNNMLKQALSKLNPETGKIMFGLRAPKGVIPFRGKLKCRLHPDDAERAVWDEMGLPICTTSALRKRHDVTRHMETRHKQEWRAIKEREAEIEKDEVRAERRALLALVSNRGAA